jgi:hypothetical protein
MIEEKIKAATDRLLDALFVPRINPDGTFDYKVDPARLEWFGINIEPINWASLRCVEVTGPAPFEVIIDECAPNECPTLCAYLETYLGAMGYECEVITEW